jgi:hypothetical protein
VTRNYCTFEGCERVLSGNGLCQMHRQQQLRGKPVTALRPPNGSTPLSERFWSKVDRGGECWIWQGTKRPQGYGVIGINNKLHYAHRISWEMANGEQIPDGMVIDHICRRPLCVRPTHLRMTTNKGNSEYRERGQVPVPESGIRGVYKSATEGKWCARVVHNQTAYNLGTFDSKEEAGRVVAAKREELFQFPEFQGGVK